MKNTTLFDQFTLNQDLTLKNRFIMAPLTRCFATDELVPTEQMAKYYARRADSGLIISEATIVSKDGQGYINTPGIFNDAQVKGWKQVTRAVHAENGLIFCQLWHCGRVSHSVFSGQTPYAPSAIGVEGTVPRMRDAHYEVPEAASVDVIETLIAAYVAGAKNAMEAGFDGVEIHGANGYLIDQFLHYASNQRDDEYGQTPENMARFALQVVDGISDAIGAEKVGLRLSPGAYFNMDNDPRDRQVFDYLLAELDKRDLAYLHVGVFDDAMTFEHLEGSMSEYMRKHTRHTLIGVGSYSAESAEQAINDERFDLIAIGRPMIANPGYVTKVANGSELNAYDDAMLTTLE